MLNFDLYNQIHTWLLLFTRYEVIDQVNGLYKLLMDIQPQK